MSNQQSLGERIRQLRGDLNTQQQLADRAGLSIALIRKLEQGTRQTCSVASLHKIARALDVTLADLLVPASIPEHDQDQGITALRHAVSLVGVPKDNPATTQEAAHAELSIWSAYFDGRHDAAVRVLPYLIRRLESGLAASNDADRPAYVHSLSRVLWAAGRILSGLRHADAAHIASQRAISLSAQLDDPVMTAAASGSLARQLMVAGRYEESIELYASTAKSIEPGRTHTIPQMSVYGNLLLSAGNVQARAGNAAEAMHFLAEARGVSNEVPDGQCHHSSVFGPSAVAMQSTDIAINLGEFGDALTASKTVPEGGSSLPTLSRSRHSVDRALVHLKTGGEDKAVALLSSTASAAPFWFKNQRLPKSIVRDLLHTPAAKSEQLRSLAKTLGVH
ncbi:helix-turn-helix domain-containing protein [Saccharopolyspora phatthalungensis]|uniref:Transcriptional regulator with XRE-family HTH domain n=1 Tax=Saccharopolyspora phatthalungensis TaxID=664693 RepID=A0A840PT96_9PSEU|nr:helix-turn-helix transcriptional regulator [Saccharopolyspora phatthalungensis]MBB5153512.1 transcriptional regulator with XRE-family HTH domain [Saccharopolyspora phatthalungensis]